MGLLEFEGRREFESGCDMKAAEEEAEMVADDPEPEPEPEPEPDPDPAPTRSAWWW